MNRRKQRAPHRLHFGHVEIRGDIFVRHPLPSAAVVKYCLTTADSSKSSSEWLTTRSGMRDFGFHRPQPNGVPSLPSTLHQRAERGGA